MIAEKFEYANPTVIHALVGSYLGLAFSISHSFFAKRVGKGKSGYGILKASEDTETLLILHERVSRYEISLSCFVQERHNKKEIFRFAFIYLTPLT